MKKIDILKQSATLLLDLVKIVSPQLVTGDVEEWFFGFVNKIDCWYKSEGNQGIKRAKASLQFVWRFVTKEPLPAPEPFLATKDSVPICVRPFYQRVKSLKLDARTMSGVLTVVRLPDLWYGKIQSSEIEKSLKVISDSKIPSTAQPIIKDFKGFIRLFKEKYPKSEIVKCLDKELDPTPLRENVFVSSRGPNGPLTSSCHKDVFSILESDMSGNSDGLFVAIMRLYDMILHSTGPLPVSTSLLESAGPRVSYDALSFGSFGPSSEVSCRILSRELLNKATMMTIMEPDKVPKHSSIPGKIGFKREKSGKVRLIAMPDYYTQQVMKPGHRWLVKCLKALPQDCTFNQSRAVPWLATWQSERRGVYSFDHSSCTDLFPVQMQMALLTQTHLKDIIPFMEDVMVKRDWEVKLPNKGVRKVRWSVGQPLGMYGSWPLMALTHHMLIQYCFWSGSGRKFPKSDRMFNRYCILGDDVVIADKATADRYRSVVKALGMKINLAKSHVCDPSTKDPVSEFAKITVWKGAVLQPIKPNMVRKAIEDWRFAVPLLSEIANASCSPQGGVPMLKKRRLTTLQRVVKKFWPLRSKVLTDILLTPKEFGGIGMMGSTRLARSFERLQAGEIHPWLYYLANKIRSAMILESQPVRLKLALPDDVPDTWVKYHPVCEISRNAPKDSYSDGQKLPKGEYEDIFGGKLDGRVLPPIRGIPSIAEIVSNLLTEGEGMYTKYIHPQLSEDDSEVPPYWELKQKIREDSFILGDCYSKVHTLPSRYQSELKHLTWRLLPPMEIAESYLETGSLDQVMSEGLNRLQFDLIKRIVSVASLIQEGHNDSSELVLP